MRVWGDVCMMMGGRYRPDVRKFSYTDEVDVVDDSGDRWRQAMGDRK